VDVLAELGGSLRTANERDRAHGRTGVHAYAVYGASVGIGVPVVVNRSLGPDGRGLCDQMVAPGALQLMLLNMLLRAALTWSSRTTPEASAQIGRL